MSRNAYFAEYQKQRYRRRRADAVAMLGGRCVECGTTEDLQFDHIDPRLKSFDVGSCMSSMTWSRLIVELSKCQLLCATHHRDKTKVELGVAHGGGVAGKSNCKCGLCRLRRRNYQRDRRQRQAVAS